MGWFQLPATEKWCWETKQNHCGAGPRLLSHPPRAARGQPCEWEDDSIPGRELRACARGWPGPAVPHHQLVFSRWLACLCLGPGSLLVPEGAGLGLSSLSGFPIVRQDPGEQAGLRPCQAGPDISR